MMVILLVPVGVAFAQTNEETQNKTENPHLLTGDMGSVGNTGVENRTWAITEQEIQEHREIVSYAVNELPDNHWNKIVKAENIRNYNLETKIGLNVDGYELSALFAALEMKNSNYNPSIPVAKMHEWAFLTYDIPDTKPEIQKRITAITNDADSTTVKELVGSVNKLVSYGAVSVELQSIDPEFWGMIPVRILCENDEYCDATTLGMDKSRGDAMPVANYNFHGDPLRQIIHNVKHLFSHVWQMLLTEVLGYNQPHLTVLGTYFE